MGDHPEHLTALAGGAGRAAVVIANAMDHVPDEVRGSEVQRELTALSDLGLAASELDLRDYVGQQQRLRRDLARVAVAWLRGGNTFVLRHALASSAGDVVFRDLLAADMLVYAGYSAGVKMVCGLSRLLHRAIAGPSPGWRSGAWWLSRAGAGSR